jgi:glyoxylase-like metal-dependent hydrolase (beta-lactamase superfamily II)
MSEPRNKARKIQEVVPGVLHWTVHDDRIDSRSDAHAVEENGRRVLIDPLPLVEEALKRLGKVEAICLTGSCHQRSAWRYRRYLGAKVYAPAGAEGLEENPDVWYVKGQKLPGGLVAIHAPGPTEVHYAFLLEREQGVLFCADILVNHDGQLAFVPAEYQDDPARTPETARSFLKLPFTTLCFAHGAPLGKDPHAAIRKALKER